MTRESRPDGPVPPDQATGRPAPRKGEQADRDGSLNAGVFLGLGLQFAVSVVGFLYLGQWIDRKLHSAPTFLLIGVFTGAGAAFFSIYRTATAEQRRLDEAARKPE
ncbi:MAG: AtpZ/AtpI family protein [Gemmatimonadaceae bacterium]|nr:AtpZ/AtpI family protein [Gemmatimonadaceae bacterium]